MVYLDNRIIDWLDGLVAQSKASGTPLTRSSLANVLLGAAALAADTTRKERVAGLPEALGVVLDG